MPNTTPETVLSDQIAAVSRQMLTLLASLNDPDTLLQKVIELADRVEDLHVGVIDTMEAPLLSTPLIDQVCAHLPAQLHPIVGAGTATEFGGAAA